MPPRLEIPVSANLKDFQKQMDNAADSMTGKVRQIGSAFSRAADFVGNMDVKMLKAGESAFKYAGIVAQISQNWSSVFGIAGKAAATIFFSPTRLLAIVGVYKILSGVIETSREQLEKMVEVADKASKATVSPEFFQSFVAESRKLKVEAEDLEKALGKAFDATKMKLDPDWSVWEGGKEKINDLFKAMQEFNLELFDASQKSQGFELFKNAPDQETKIRGVLTMMVELEAIGQKAAALDLGEKMFGGTFVDRILQGKTSAAEMLDTLQKMQRTDLEKIFSNGMVQRAKEVDDKLKQAHQTLERELQPSLNDANSYLLTMKSLWADIINLTARAASLSALFSSQSENAREIARRDNIIARQNAGDLTPSQRERSDKQLEHLNKRLAEHDALLARELALSNLAAGLGINEVGAGTGGNIPIPRRRPDDAPKPEKEKSGGGSEHDKLGTSIESIEKRIAGINAEAAAIDLGTAARERSKVAAELETIAKQANKEAGLGENIVTAEQAAQIAKVAEAYGLAREKIEAANAPLATFARESRNVGKVLNEFGVESLRGFETALTDVIMQSKTAAEAFSALTKSILADLVKIAIRAAITGPIAGAFGSIFGGGGGGIGGLFGGARAGGGPVRPGMAYKVNENTPRSEWFVPGVSGRVVPDHVARRGGSGGAPVQVTIVSQPVFQAGMTPTDMAAIEQRLSERDADLRTQVQEDFMRRQSLDSQAYSGG